MTLIIADNKLNLQHPKAKECVRREEVESK